MRRWVAPALLSVVVCASGEVAAAQQVAPPADSHGFLSRYDFHVTAAALSEDDIQFQWDAGIGAGIDLFDYGVGRVHVLANYHAVLGNELQPFDPNQSYYTFDVSGSYRINRSELAAHLHHVSRHLGDRQKQFGVDWNAIGARLDQTADRDRLDLLISGYFDYVVKSTFVDYEFMTGAAVSARYPNDRRVSLVASGRADVVLTDEDIGGRSRVSGGIADVGVRLEGSRAALELFVALERRIDPSPLTHGTEQWALAGFRLLTR